jgi:hypothetical protein
MVFGRPGVLHDQLLDVVAAIFHSDIIGHGVIRPAVRDRGSHEIVWTAVRWLSCCEECQARKYDTREMEKITY